MTKFPALIPVLLPYWEKAHNRVELKWSPEEAEANLGAIRTDIDVHDTGVGGRAFIVIQEIIDQGNIPIFTLPISHAALNIKRENLIILGPAFKTRDDVYVFRSRKLKPNNRKYNIGVRENDLTTTNMSKVIIHHMNFDYFFFSNVKDHLESFSTTVQCDEHHSDFIDRVNHKFGGEVNERIERLLTGEFDAALFMGKDLLVRKDLFFIDDIIPVVNLNRCICNLYSVSFFPRAVFVTSQEIWERHQNAVTYYLDLFSDVADSIFKKYYKDRKFRQSPCRTGKKADLVEVKVLIEFARDTINKSMPHHEAHRYESIEIKNFAFKSTYKLREKMERFVIELRKTSPNIVCRVHERRKYEKIGRIIGAICDEIYEIIKEKGALCEKETILKFIDKTQELELDERAAFKQWVEEYFS